MITVSTDSGRANFDSFTFNGGEEHVRFDKEAIHKLQSEPGVVTIKIPHPSSADIMRLVMLTDAIRRINRHIPIQLKMSYFPYARQDRVCNPGEAFALKAFADIINSLKFCEVVVKDPHSDVLAGVVDNLTIIPADVGVKNALAHLKHTHDSIVLISPDAGAEKKTLSYAKETGYPALFARKVRDPSTGQILCTQVIDSSLVRRQACLIVDDICDGGFTFIKLAEELYKHGAVAVYLYVTHGIFSKGIKPLQNAGIKRIFTTNNFLADYDANLSSVS